MKYGFQIMGILTLLIGSFVYTEKVDLVSKLNDDLLLEIKEKSPNYKQNAIEPTIENNTIIPGLNGKEVDIKKSYQKMRQIGYFNEKFLVYKQIKLQNNLKNNKNKYIISGNKQNKHLTLIFTIDKNKKINNIINILNKNNIKATFFINSKYLEENYNEIIKLLTKGHTIGILNDGENYTSPEFIWMKTIIINSGKQKHNYCYSNQKNKLILKNCSIQNSYTIIPTITIKNKPFIYTKNNITEGAILSYEPTQELEKELENIINYIISKGYKIKSLEKLLQE